MSMNLEQLEQAQKEWGFSMDIWLKNGRIYVANDGYITDSPSDVKAGKHSGEYNGFFFYSKRKGTTNVLKSVISSFSPNFSSILSSEMQNHWNNVMKMPVLARDETGKYYLKEVA
jgi:hypothetical protein